MGSSKENSFDEFLSNLQMNENIYFLVLHFTLRKPTLFLKPKLCDLCTNPFNTHVGSFVGNKYRCAIHLKSIYSYSLLYFFI